MKVMKEVVGGKTSWAYEQDNLKALKRYVVLLILYAPRQSTKVWLTIQYLPRSFHPRLPDSNHWGHCHNPENTENADTLDWNLLATM
jgi:hypothetical protein